MLRKTFFLIFAAILLVLAMPSKGQAWYAYHYGGSRYGAYGGGGYHYGGYHYGGYGGGGAHYGYHRSW
jgi:hypothetical protein